MSQTRPPRWGTVTTVKAPFEKIEEFAAYHLELGASRVTLYLDEDRPDHARALSRHPKVRAILAGPGTWRGNGPRPELTIEERQAQNARHAYIRSKGLDWLAHIDVDEFLWPHAAPMAEQLAALPAETPVARIRPVEALAPDPENPPPAGVTWFKGFKRNPRARVEATRAIYPTFGPYLDSGFLSHVAGKLFFRTGIEDLRPNIHIARRHGQRVDDEADLTTTRLCHFHAADWPGWLADYRWRIDRGSYRDGMRPKIPEHLAGLPFFEIFRALEETDGEAGLAAFFYEVCTARPELLARLKVEGLLYSHRLDLAGARTRQFAEIPPEQ